MISIGGLEELEDHSRYIVSMRSKSLGSKYHSIVIYAIDRGPSSNEKDLIPDGLDDRKALRDPVIDSVNLTSQCSSRQREWHAIEEECPHLGASMAEAEIEIEIEDDGVVAICPWHNYDFNLRTGQSSTGLRACVLPTTVIDGKLHVGFPEGATDWTLVSLRPVSQRFAIPNLDPEQLESSILSLARPQPKSLIEWGTSILRTSNPDLKINLTRHAIGLFRRGEIPIVEPATPLELLLPPETPTRESVQIVHPADALKRGRGGNLANRIKLLHALANIELWAIDLAWDIITRFYRVRVDGQELPRAFFSDFAKVAEDEAKHFTLLREALKRLGRDWGDLPIHDGLWQSARDTSHSLVSRLCIIHLVHEARGLDVNPTQIKRVREAGDVQTAESLEIIHADEVTHVAAGHRWLCYICSNSSPKVEPVTVFRREVEAHFFGRLKPPFNVEDRAKAGLDPSFYQDL